MHPQRSKQGINSLELEQPMFVSCLMWVQGVDLESFARTVYAVLLITEPSLQPREFFFFGHGSLLALWKFHVMYSTAQLPVLPYLSCTPAAGPQIN